MSRLVDPFLVELDEELPRTRALLEAVPEEHLAWRPHERSMTLGQLARHVATIPGRIVEMASGDGFDVETADYQAPEPESKAELLRALDESAGAARETLSALDDDAYRAPWSLSKGSAVLMTIPRSAMLRSFLVNHLCHHRGQLTVYLRLLDVPVPATYGRSADVRPFG